MPFARRRTDSLRDSFADGLPLVPFHPIHPWSVGTAGIHQAVAGHWPETLAAECGKQGKFTCRDWLTEPFGLFLTASMLARALRGGAKETLLV